MKLSSTKQLPHFHNCYLFLYHIFLRYYYVHDYAAGEWYNLSRAIWYVLHTLSHLISFMIHLLHLNCCCSVIVSRSSISSVGQVTLQSTLRAQIRDNSSEVASMVVKLKQLLNFCSVLIHIALRWIH